MTISALSTVMVVPLTTNLRRAEAIGSVALAMRDTGLLKDSVALVCQVMTLDKSFLDAMVRRLPARLMRSVRWTPAFGRAGTWTGASRPGA